jgi:DNA-binding response OmpR family regulator
MAATFPANANILLLISDPLMCTILQETLERAGYLVVSASDVGSAVDRVKQMRPDLLIIRPYVASMPGHMAAHHLRTWCPGLPVLILTGFMEDQRIRDQHELREFYVFPKPFGRDELLATVKEVLRSAHGKAR